MASLTGAAGNVFWSRSSGNEPQSPFMSNRGCFMVKEQPLLSFYAVARMNSDASKLGHCCPEEGCLKLISLFSKL